jgi:beta-galactosidase
MHPQRTRRLFEKLWHGADYNYEQWLDMPEVVADDFRLMRLAHFNIVSVGIFSWVMLEPEEGCCRFDWLDDLMDRLAETEIMAALATPSAAPPAWLSRKYPETRRVNEHGQRQPHRGRQNFCYSSPVYREKVTALNRRLAERYGSHPALLMWHVSNEYVSTPCHCDLCYAAFRRWLQARYGDLDTLNHAWWTTFWSHRFTDWDEIEPVDRSVHGLMLDWQRFTSDRALDFFLAESVPLRELTPDVPITTNFMQPDVGLDYWRFAPHLDVMSWDSYPRWHQTGDVTTAMETAFYHDLHRSYKQGQPFLLMESTPSVTNWQGISRVKRPGAHKATSLQAVAHGSNSVQYFQWRQSRGGDEKFHGAVISHLNSQDTRVFRDVAEVGDILRQLPGLAQTAVRAPVAIVYDFENGWALNHARLPGSLAKNYLKTCQQHYAPFWQRGVSADIIHAEADLNAYRIVVAPMLYMLRPGVAERIEAFVQAGGIVVTTYLSGIVNESDLCFMNGYPPPLRRALGLFSEELDALASGHTGAIVPCDGSASALNGSYQFHDYAELVHLESAHMLAAYASDFYAGRPALTVNDHGAGQAYYVAARTDDRFLSDFYDDLLARAGLSSPVQLAAPLGVSIQVREGVGQRFVFVMNFSGQEQPVAVGDTLTDALTNAPIADSLLLQPYDATILIQEIGNAT